MIPDQNYDNDNDASTNEYELTVVAKTIPGDIRGFGGPDSFTDGEGVQAGWTVDVPMTGEVMMDDNGGDFGWYFDPTLLDDAEFTAVVNSFHSSFLDTSVSGQASTADFYRVVAHEIGHALGLLATTGLGVEYQGAISDYLSHVFLPDNSDFARDPMSNTPLRRYFNPATGFEAMLTPAGGGHIYEGFPSDPPGVFGHPNELMNAGRLESGEEPRETKRRLISDLTVGLLADAYGYEFVLPSTLDTAQATLDSQTGTLLIQGLPDAVNENIDLNLINNGNDIEVLVGGTRELVPSTEVTKIVIAKNNGVYAISVDNAITQPWQEVQYLVSSNEDAVDSGTIGDGLVDLDTNVPGNQVTLRAAVQDANGAGGGAIYVPRGNYQLILTGSGGDAEGDLNITSDVIIVGAGPGATVITSSTDDRHFKVESSGTLTVERLTLTGGSVPGGAWGLRSMSMPEHLPPAAT